MKTGRGSNFKTVDKPTSFCTHGIFSDLPPEIKGLFDGFYTDLGENNSFWEKIADIPPTVRCPSISKKPVEICGGDIVPLYICIERVAFEM